jgi:hypothetical protein
LLSTATEAAKGYVRSIKGGSVQDRNLLRLAGGTEGGDVDLGALGQHAHERPALQFGKRPALNDLDGIPFQP